MEFKRKEGFFRYELNYVNESYLIIGEKNNKDSINKYEQKSNNDKYAAIVEGDDARGRVGRKRKTGAQWKKQNGVAPGIGRKNDDDYDDDDDGDENDDDNDYDNDDEYNDTVDQRRVFDAKEDPGDQRRGKEKLYVSSNVREEENEYGFRKNDANARYATNDHEDEYGFTKNDTDARYADTGYAPQLSFEGN